MTTIAKRNINWFMIGLVPVAIALGAAAVHGVMMLIPPPSDLDLSRIRTSENGSFVASIEPGVISVDETHAWIVELKMVDGTPPAIGAVTIDGGMPVHGHGLPAQPKVIRDLGSGRFEVEGVTFSMSGWWVVNVHVDTPSGADKATFNFTL
jgi:hypothetical protein